MSAFKVKWCLMVWVVVNPKFPCVKLFEKHVLNWRAPYNPHHFFLKLSEPMFFRENLLGTYLISTAFPSSPLPFSLATGTTWENKS